MSRTRNPTPEQLHWLDQCEPIRAVDIRDMGLPYEENHEIGTGEDLLELFEGIDEQGRAL